MAQGYTVVGLKELQRELRNYDKEIPKSLRKASLRAAEVVAEEARKRAPVDTGRLQKSTKAQATQTSASVKSGSPSRVPYANPVHWGWMNRPQGGFNPRTPFISEALNVKYDEMVATFHEAMDELRKNKGLD